MSVSNRYLPGQRKASARPSCSRFARIARMFLLVVPLSFLFAACQSSTTGQAETQTLQSGNGQPTIISQTGSTSTSTPGSTSNPQPVGQAGNWKMIFHDEFNENALDTSKWTTCYFNFKVGSNSCDHDQGELELYQPGNVTISNGVLTLTADKKTVDASNGQTYDYTSGMITTGPTTANPNNIRFSFKYGYMEMRAKLPAGQGLWPAFWTLPTNLNWPPEIDVFEYLGNQTNVMNMHYHFPNGSDDGGDSGTKWTGPDFSAGWHTYAVDWEPNAITWYIDGVKRATYTDASQITSDPMYLVANLAVGGEWPGAPDASTHFPALYQIDYIRVWQKQ